jgi:hypothetical protein
VAVVEAQTLILAAAVVGSLEVTEVPTALPRLKEVLPKTQVQVAE